MSINNSTNPTQETIDKCKETLCEELTSAHASKQACDTKKITKQNTIKYNTCCLAKTKASVEFYNKLNLCVCIPVKKKTDLLKEEVKKATKKKEELANLLKDAVKEVKKVKTKMAEAQDEACKLKRCLEEEERCNPDLYKELKKLNITIGTETIPFCTEDNQDSAIGKIIEKTKECYKDITTTFDAGIEIVGIQTFANVTILEPTSDALINQVKLFKTDIENNTKKANEAYTKAIEELAKCMEEQETTAIECCTSTTSFESCKKTRQFICEENPCDGKDSADALAQICEDLKGTTSGNDEGDTDFDCDNPDADSGGTGNDGNDGNNGTGTTGSGTGRSQWSMTD